MALYDHIRELRAELAVNTSRKEIRQIRRELEVALAELARINPAGPVVNTAF